MKKIVWFIALLGSVIGVFFTFVALKSGGDGTRNAALIALASSVSTYVFAKAASEVFTGKP